MNLLRHPRLDDTAPSLRVQPETTVAGLPLYDTRQVAWDSLAIEAAGELKQPRFVRRARLARIGDTGHLDLPETLAAASAALADAVDAFGGQVIGHVYGIAELPTNIDFKPEVSPSGCNMLLPSGFGLVAETDVIKGAVELHRIFSPGACSDRYSKLVERTVHRHRNHQIYWPDHASDQFRAVPIQKRGGNTDYDIVLPDIDPLIQRQSAESKAQQDAFIVNNAYRFR